MPQELETLRAIESPFTLCGMSGLADLSKALKSLRDARRLRQEDVARRAGITTAMLSRYETGSRAPHLATLDAVLRALGADLHDLADAMSGVGGQTPDGPRGRARAAWVEALRQRGIDRDVIFGFAHGALSGDDPKGAADLVASAQEAARLIAESELEQRRKTLAEIEAEGRDR